MNTVPKPNQASESEYGEDPMDRYSQIIHTQDLVTQSGVVVGRKLTKVRRNNPEKPGRTLAAVWDSREIVAPGFEELSYGYLVRFDKQAGVQADPAGKHFHRAKDELMVAVHGKMLVVLEDTNSKEQSRIVISSDEHVSDNQAIESMIYVPAGVAHAVVPLDDGPSTLLVLANHPGVSTDEFPYEMHV